MINVSLPKKVVMVTLIVGAACIFGCGKPADADASAAAPPPANSAMPDSKKNATMHQQAMAAPPGVKTGTP